MLEFVIVTVDVAGCHIRGEISLRTESRKKWLRYRKKQHVFFGFQNVNI